MKQTGKMTKVVLVLLLAGCLLGLCGCGSQQSVSGCYMVDYALPLDYSDELTFTPWVKFDPTDNTFIFMYGECPSPMQAPGGSYTIEGNTITAQIGDLFYWTEPLPSD